ncbi:MAG: hypothetical protein IH810_05480 [Proteobacteria bacterium]|nr:hypothetical protein [Pseudomonadota bacterium]
MNALPLIFSFADRDVSVVVRGSDLTLNAPKGALTPKLVDRLRQDKADVLRWLAELRAILGEDWEEISQDPAQLRAAADSLMTQISRKRGVTPTHYTATVHCETCNQDVSHFPVDGDTVGACVWCLNGQPVPTSP